jgi:serine O-acetyltransferase
MTFPQLIDLIRWDMRVNQGFSLDRIRAKLVLIEIRLEQYIYHKFGEEQSPLRLVWYLGRFLGSVFQWLLCNSNIPGSVTIGKGFRLPHPQNIIIAGLSDIGEFCTIYQNVSIAWNGFKPTVPLRPKIGSQVLIGAGAIIVGDIDIGSYVLVGAGAIVAQSVPDYSRVTSVHPNISSRPLSLEAVEPGSEKHLKDPYSIWR